MAESLHHGPRDAAHTEGPIAYGPPGAMLPRVMIQPTTTHRRSRGGRPLPLCRSTALALLAGASALSGCGGPEPVERPNVILITLDTVRADFLSCYGSTSGATPGVDRLAAAGTVFEDAASASGLTPASHATILTGKFQYNHGLRVLAAGSGFQLDPDEETLTTAFKAAGYRTAAIHSAFPVSAFFGFDEGFDEFKSFDTTLKKKKDDTKVGWDVRSYQRRSDDTTRMAVEWLNEASQGDQPFFLWLHYWDPHDPVKLPDEADFERLRYDPGTGELQDEATVTYAVEVRYQDGNLETLFQAIDDAGLTDETLVALTADHGQGLADGMRKHRWGMHRMLYREQTHVPFILRGPGIPAGRRVPDQVRTADMAPTLLDYAGLGDFSEPVDGTSLRPWIEGEMEGDLTAYGEQINGYDHNAGMRKFRPDAAFLYMVSDGEWKLIYKPHMPGTSELFHVGVDPLEERNVIADHPDVVVGLLADLAERNPWVTAPFPIQGASGASGSADALNALGYSAADVEGSGDWWWTCPVHTDQRLDRRGRCEVDGCGRITISMGRWTE